MAPMRQQVAPQTWIDEADALRLMRDRTGLRRPQQDKSDAERRHDVLRRTVENEVVPRLLLSRRANSLSETRALASTALPSDTDVADLTGLLLSSDESRPLSFVEAMHHAGIAPESLYLDLLAPTARRLGTMWEEDLCDFTEVTIGLMRLQHVMRALSPAFIGDCETTRAGARALLIQIPGEQHGFGLSMVVQFFRRAGWNVCNEKVADSAELISLVKTEFFAMVGISVACSDRIESLATDIRAIRRHSRNPAICIMVGGPPFLEHPQLAALVGADATASDGRQAVRQAQSLVSLLARDR